MATYSMVLSKSDEALLNRIKKRRGTSKSTIMRNALHIYDLISREIDESRGDKLAVVDKDDKISLFIVLPQ